MAFRKKLNVSNFFLVFIVLLVSALPYFKVSQFEFVDFDDPSLIYLNSAVIDFDLNRIFFETHAEDYLPITTLSFAIEHAVFGMNPYIFHINNLILHLLNVLLVYLLVNTLLPNRLFVSIFTSLFFGIHPLHVESVAWLSQRKDVLSTFFYLTSLITFMYISKKTLRVLQINFLYLLSFLLFVLAVSTKAMSVTLPLVLIMISLYRKDNLKILLIRLIPFIIVTSIFCYIHINLHNSPSQLDEKGLSYASLIKNGFDSLAFYIEKTVAPVKLSAFYEKGVVSVNYVSYFFIALWISITTIFLKIDKRPTLLLNMFFLISIAPVLQIIPFGNNFSFADRFMYLPSIGLFCFVSLAFDYIRQKNIFRKITHLTLLIVILSFTFLTYKQSLTWRNSKALWENAYVNYPNSSVANNNLGIQLMIEGNIEQSIQKFKEAISIDKNYIVARYSLAVCYMRLERYQEASIELVEALKINAKDPHIYFNLGVLNEKTNNFQTAMDYYLKSIQVDSNFVAGYINYSTLLFKNGQKTQAINILSQIEKVNSVSAMAYTNLGSMYLDLEGNETKNIEYALKYLNKSIAIDPNNEQAYRSRAIAYIKIGQIDKGMLELKKADELKK